MRLLKWLRIECRYKSPNRNKWILGGFRLDLVFTQSNVYFVMIWIAVNGSRRHLVTRHYEDRIIAAGFDEQVGYIWTGAGKVHMCKYRTKPCMFPRSPAQLALRARVRCAERVFTGLH